MQQPSTMWKSVFYPYLSYVALFLGMGLISGAIVHMPVSPFRYAIILLIGVVMFGFASFVSEIATQEMTMAAIVRSLVFSLLVSVGIGMISGGIQHYEDNPAYSAILIPIGFGISLFSFIIKNNVRLSIKRLYGVLLVFLVLVVPLSISLNYMAASTIAQSAGHPTGHSH